MTIAPIHISNSPFLLVQYMKNSQWKTQKKVFPHHLSYTERLLWLSHFIYHRQDVHSLLVNVPAAFL